MRKTIVSSSGAAAETAVQADWLDLQPISTVEVTSENPNFPIESVFAAEPGSGWKASTGGDQRIRLIFDNPVSLHRIRLSFAENEVERTQEFILRWSPNSSGPMTDVVRQQWNFSPTGSVSQVEDYKVNLTGVGTLELEIRPDIGGRKVVASLISWQVA